MSLLKTSCASQLYSRCLGSAFNGINQNGRHCVASRGACTRQYSSFQARKPHGDAAGMSTNPKLSLQFRSYSMKEVFQVLPDAYIWVHQTTGLPWWILIVLGAFTVRLPVYCLMPAVHRRRANRMKAMSFIYAEQTRLAQSIATQPLADKKTDEEISDETKKQLKKIEKKVIRKWKCQLWKSFIHFPVLIPIWILNTNAIRRLVRQCGVDEQCAMLAYEGPFSSDLMLAHPILGVLMFFSVIHLVELPRAMQRLRPSETKFPGMERTWGEVFDILSRNGGRCAAVIPLVYGQFFPSAIMLSMLVGNASMAVLQTTMHVPTVRRFFRITPTPYESQNLPKDLLVHYKALAHDAQESVRKEREVNRKAKEGRRNGWRNSWRKSKSNEPDSGS